MCDIQEGLEEASAERISEHCLAALESLLLKSDTEAIDHIPIVVVRSFRSGVSGRTRHQLNAHTRRNLVNI